MIVIRGLTKRYASRDGSTVTALEDINLHIGQGEFVVAVGPSGCGKSTMLKTVAGLLKGFEGAVEVEGKPVTGPRRDIGMMFQTPVLLPWRTVLNNVLLPIEVYGQDLQGKRRQAMELLAKVGLADFAEKYPWELSGGMQQRVAIVRTLITDPKLMLMDEPFGALDEFTREALNQELLKVWSERRNTVLLVTHSINEAVYLADRVVIMSPRPGRIVSVEDIDLPRPRGLDILVTDQFSHYVQEVRRKLGVGNDAKGD